MRRALGLLALTALQLAAVPARSDAPSGDVLGVRVVPAPGRAEVVVDIRGPVQATDFVLQSPPRLVLDLTGARLVGPALQYDGVDRGGILNIRYSQFRSDVVRVVIELAEARDYEVTQEEGAVRVTFAAGQTFAAWPAGAVPAAAAPVAAAAADLPSAIPTASRRTGEAATAAPQQQAAQQRGTWTFYQTNIDEVLATFAAQSGRSIIAGRGVGSISITAEIRDQPWDVALRVILQSRGLEAQEQVPSGIIIVDLPTNLVPAQDSSAPVSSRHIRIYYARASQLRPSVEAMLTRNRGSVAADSASNSLIVTDLAGRLDEIERIIRDRLDQRTPQVAISAKIIFVNRTDLENIGLQYDLGTDQQFYNRLIQRYDIDGNPIGDPTGGRIAVGGNAVAAIANAQARFADNSALELVYSTVLGNFQLSTFLQALQQVQLSDVQAEPQVTVVDNQQAEIWVGERTPVRVIDAAAGGAAGGAARATTRMEETGIRLRVTPHVVPGTREVLMELHAERSSVEPSAIAEIGAIFSTQEGTTQVLVRDGETAVIGGLTVTEITVSKSGIPFLVDLPVIGRLFGFRTSKEQRRDLLILVTPHLVDDLSANEPAQRQ